LLIYLQPVKPILETRGSFRATLSQKVSAGAHMTCGGPRAAPSREAGAGAVGARSCPEPGGGSQSRGKHGSLGAAPSREARVIVLT
jgi:hypothetical protein